MGYVATSLWGLIVTSNLAADATFRALYTQNQELQLVVNIVWDGLWTINAAHCVVLWYTDAGAALSGEPHAKLEESEDGADF